MAIVKDENKFTGTTTVYATGIVKKITFFENKNKTYNTHTASIMVNGGYIKMGVTQKGDFPLRVQYQTGDKPNIKYHTLEVGDEVVIEVKEKEWQGKISYETTISRIRVTQKGPGEQSPAAEKIASPDTLKSAEISAARKETTNKPDGVKIYGEVLAIDNNLAVVKDKDSKSEHKVKFGEQQQGVVVGGFVGAYISAEGDILNNYKYYPPKQSNGKKADALGSPERNFKMAFGNMVNVSSIALPKGSDKDVFEFAQQLFKPAQDLREKLLKEFEGIRDEGDVGGKLGNALKHAAERSGNDTAYIIHRAESWFRMHISSEEEMKDILSGAVKQDDKTSAVNEVADKFEEVDEDFDDLPF